MMMKTKSKANDNQDYTKINKRLIAAKNRITPKEGL